jgi:hypothetical protein
MCGLIGKLLAKLARSAIAVARGRPHIAAFAERIVTEPVGGHGLADTQG